jgi:hypothetical protein
MAYIRVMDGNGCIWFMPITIQQTYGLRDFLQDLSLVLGIALTVRNLMD